MSWLGSLLQCLRWCLQTRFESTDHEFHRGPKRRLRTETLETRRLLAGDSSLIYQPSTDPAVGAVVTAFLIDAPTDPADDFHIGSNWITAVNELADVGATEVTFGVYRAVDNFGNLLGGPTISEVAGAVTQANSRGLSVTILPLFEVEHIGWRGEYDPSDQTKERFREQYRDWISQLASINGIDRFNIGSELNAMVNNADNLNFFRDLIQTVKSAGHFGEIGYVANFDAYDNAQHRAVWQLPDMDYLAISAYFSVTSPADASLVAGADQPNDSVMQSMISSWTQQLDQLEQVADSLSLPAVIQEFGAVQRNYSSVYPWATEPGNFLDGASDPLAEDPLEQRAVYEALFAALDGRANAFDSVHVYAWEHGSSRGRRFYDNVDPSEPRYIDHFAIWPTDGGAGQFVTEYLSTAHDGDAPTVYTVTNSLDTGPGSLRDAILAANRDEATAASIRFDIPGNGPHEIELLSALPVIASPTTIDATTEPDYVGSPVIGIDGSALSGKPDGFRIESSEVVISGVSVHGFAGDGIEIFSGANNVVQNSWIGVDPRGQAAANQNGLRIRDSSKNRVQQNVISGNLGAGVIIDGASSDNVLADNVIGTTPNGQSAQPNTTGIVLRSPDNFIGTAGAGNLISGNLGAGVSVSSTANRTQIQANQIGTNLSGTSPLANGSYGLLVRSNENQIGGVTQATSNTISGNGRHGLIIVDGDDNFVIGNQVGTSRDGTSAVPNLSYGVYLSKANNNVIGGTLTGQANLISGNARSGLAISQSHHNQIVGNLIGTNQHDQAIGNQSAGVHVSGGSTYNVFSSNVISGNRATGVILVGASTSNNWLHSNSIGVTLDEQSELGNGSFAILVSAPNNTIGGETHQANVIAGSRIGIAFSGSNATGNQIQANFIGTNREQFSQFKMETGIQFAKLASNNIVSPNTLIAHVDQAIRLLSSSGAGNKFR